MFSCEDEESCDMESMENTDPDTFNDLYQLGDIIGKGPFSVVRCCFRRSTGERFAVKIVDVSKFPSSDKLNKFTVNERAHDGSNDSGSTSNSRATISQHLTFEDLKREATICSILRHPNIVQLIETFSCNGVLFMIFEYMDGGDLCFEIVKRASSGYVYSESVCAHYISQLLDAIEYAHQMGIVHTEIKPHCILLSSNDNSAPVKLGGFGSAVQLSTTPDVSGIESSGKSKPTDISEKTIPAGGISSESGHASRRHQLQHMESIELSAHSTNSSADSTLSHTSSHYRIKTPSQLIAPELVPPNNVNISKFEKAVDIWAIGILAHILLTGRTPHFNDTGHTVNNDERDRGTTDSREHEINKELKLATTSYIWPKCISIEARDMVKRMLEPNPSERITATESLQHPWLLNRFRVASRTHLRRTVELLRQFNVMRKAKGRILSTVNAMNSDHVIFQREKYMSLISKSKNNQLCSPHVHEKGVSGTLTEQVAVSFILDALDEIPKLINEPPKPSQINLNKSTTVSDTSEGITSENNTDILVSSERKTSRKNSKALARHSSVCKQLDDIHLTNCLKLFHSISINPILLKSQVNQVMSRFKVDPYDKSNSSVLVRDSHEYMFHVIEMLNKTIDALKYKDVGAEKHNGGRFDSIEEQSVSPTDSCSLPQTHRNASELVENITTNWFFLFLLKTHDVIAHQIYGVDVHVEDLYNSLRVENNHGWSSKLEEQMSCQSDCCRKCIGGLHSDSTIKTTCNADNANVCEIIDVNEDGTSDDSNNPPPPKTPTRTTSLGGIIGPDERRTRDVTSPLYETSLNYSESSESVMPGDSSNKQNAQSESIDSSSSENDESPYHITKIKERAGMFEDLRRASMCHQNDAVCNASDNDEYLYESDECQEISSPSNSDRDEHEQVITDNEVNENFLRNMQRNDKECQESLRLIPSRILHGNMYYPPHHTSTPNMNVLEDAAPSEHNQRKSQFLNQWDDDRSEDESDVEHLNDSRCIKFERYFNDRSPIGVQLRVYENLEKQMKAPQISWLNPEGHALKHSTDLEVGDILLEINGISLHNQTLPAVQRFLDDARGTVVLKLLRKRQTTQLGHIIHKERQQQGNKFYNQAGQKQQYNRNPSSSSWNDYLEDPSFFGKDLDTVSSRYPNLYETRSKSQCNLRATDNRSTMVALVDTSFDDFKRDEPYFHRDRSRGQRFVEMNKQCPNEVRRTARREDEFEIDNDVTTTCLSTPKPEMVPHRTIARRGYETSDASSSKNELMMSSPDVYYYNTYDAASLKKPNDEKVMIYDDHKTFLRALRSYNPFRDETCPLPQAGLQFSTGDVLEVLNKKDIRWWQARVVAKSTDLTFIQRPFMNGDEEAYSIHDFDGSKQLNDCDVIKYNKNHEGGYSIEKISGGLIPSPYLQDIRSKKKKDAKNHLKSLVPLKCKTYRKGGGLLNNETTHGSNHLCVRDSDRFHDYHSNFERNSDIFDEGVGCEDEEEETTCSIFNQSMKVPSAKPQKLLSRVWQRLGTIDKPIGGSSGVSKLLSDEEHLKYNVQHSRGDQFREDCESLKSNSFVKRGRRFDVMSPIRSTGYEQVIRISNFKRKTLVLLGAHGVGRRFIKNSLIEISSNSSTRSIVDCLLTYAYPIPHTTRPPKRFEKDGQNYFFTTHDEMMFDISTNEYLEYGSHDTHMYGTKLETIRRIIDSDRLPILDIEPKALEILRNEEFAPFVVFIRAPRDKNSNSSDNMSTSMMMESSNSRCSSRMSRSSHHYSSASRCSDVRMASRNSSQSRSGRHNDQKEQHFITNKRLMNSDTSNVDGNRKDKNNNNSTSSVSTTINMSELERESDVLERKYGHLFDLTIVNSDMRKTINILDHIFSIVTTINTNNPNTRNVECSTIPSSQWVPQAWFSS